MSARYEDKVADYVVMRTADAIACLPAWPLAFLALLAAVATLPRLVRITSETWSPRLLLNQAARDWATIILLFAVTDFLGYGVQPPIPTWGNMLSNMISNLQVTWWAALFPGVCISGAVFLIETMRSALVGEPFENQILRRPVKKP